MSSRIPKRLTYSNVLATLALFFAMSGGALAASHYLITSTKQISPKVLKSLRGHAGPAGKGGANGMNGAPGSEGPQGPAGSSGGKGEQGPEGKKGEQGQTGPEGSPWTDGGTLPKHKTETGTWSVTAGSFVASSETVSAVLSISFTIPLEHAPQVEVVNESNISDHTSECPSEFAELEAGAVAKAEPGFLCIYSLQGPLGEELHTIVESANGAVVGASFPKEESKAGQVAYGVWAVTAE